MKCNSCGYNLNIEDLFCPHCGTKNNQAAKHESDMKHFDAEFENTRQEVISNSKRFNAFTAKLTIIAVLIALIAIGFIVASHSYDIVRWRIARQIDKHEPEYRAELSGYEKDRDFDSIIRYYQTHEILRAYDSALNDFNTVYQMSNHYTMLEGYIRQLYAGPESSNYTEEYLIEMIAKYVDHIDTSSEYNEYRRTEFDGEHGDFIQYVRQLTQDTVQVYFKLTDEQADSLYDLSVARRTVMLEEAFENAK